MRDRERGGERGESEREGRSIKKGRVRGEKARERTIEKGR